MLLALALWAVGALPVGAEGSGLGPYGRYAAARDRADAREAAAAFARWAIWDGTGPCRQTPCVGRTAIQREIDRRITQGVRTNVTGVKAGDGVVTATIELRWHALDAAGVPRLVGTETVVADDQSIDSLRFRLDPTDPTTARFQASHQTDPVWDATPDPLPAALRQLVDKVLGRH